MTVDNVLYSFRRCPYALRARWAILNCEIKVVLREVDLKEKPTELIELSPKGTVPVLFTNKGEIIDESMDIILWALSLSKKHSKMLSNSEIYKKELLSIIKENDTTFKYHLDRFKYSSRYNKLESENHKDEARKILSKWNKILLSKGIPGKRNWLISESESIADWAIWPFVRQYYIADPIFFKENKNFTPLKDWLSYYVDDPLFKILMTKVKKWESSDHPYVFGVNQ
tara:strand:+ start:353 stop:1033 length:681 start_codon:yes stop_codon:yes gene_type:complete